MGFCFFGRIRQRGDKSKGENGAKQLRSYGEFWCFIKVLHVELEKFGTETIFHFSYGGGTHPWNRSGGSVEPSTDDGMIEVVGLTTYQLVITFFYYYKYFPSFFTV